VPRGVWSQDANALLLDDINHLLLNLCAKLVHFGKPSGGKNHLSDALFGAFPKSLGGVSGGKKNDGKVDAVGQGCN